eukprot:6062528-Prymnesium_polylepis.1
MSAWAASKTLMELRVHMCQKSPASAGVRCGSRSQPVVPLLAVVLLSPTAARRAQGFLGQKVQRGQARQHFAAHPAPGERGHAGEADGDLRCAVRAPRWAPPLPDDQLSPRERCANSNTCVPTAPFWPPPPAAMGKEESMSVDGMGESEFGDALSKLMKK